MHKPIALAVLACFGFAGCQAFTTSKTWEKVTQVRSDAAPDDANPSGAYAAKLHKVLKDDSVEHKLVTYQYHYTTRLREEAIGTRTAVLYRDNTDQKNPWWLMDERLARPVWVPGENPQDQLIFYLGHSADVTEEKDFPAAPQEQKAVAGPARIPNDSARPGNAPQANFHSVVSAKYYQLAAPLPETPAPSASSIALFRSVHGTPYNPSSPLDRKKMARLKAEAPKHPQPPAEAAH